VFSPKVVLDRQEVDYDGQWPVLLTSDLQIGGRSPVCWVTFCEPLW